MSGGSNSWDSNRSTGGNTNMYGTNNQSHDRNRSGSSWMNDNDNDNDHARFSHGNAMENRYSDDYSHPRNDNWGSNNYDEDRYRRNRSNDNDDNNGGEGFFERIGHGIRDAWNSIAGDDNDRDDYDNNRRGSAGGPPYNYGSGSNTAGW